MLRPDAHLIVEVIGQRDQLAQGDAVGLTATSGR
jgi:hypothetical protein